jgi:hypothetical protein
LERAPTTVEQHRHKPSQARQNRNEQADQAHQRPSRTKRRPTLIS